jgi:hypothetical protein
MGNLRIDNQVLSFSYSYLMASIGLVLAVFKERKLTVINVMAIETTMPATNGQIPGSVLYTNPLSHLLMKI